VTATVDRRDRIVAAAARLFAERGIAGTTVRMIGDEVGVLSGSLYHHFDSKEEMVDVIISSYFTELLDRYKAVLATGHGPRQRLEGLARESFRSIADHPQACEIYRNDYKYLAALPRFDYVVKATRRVQRIWLQEIAAGVEAGELRDDIDAGLFYRFARDAIWQSARWYTPRGPHSIDEIADACVSVLLDGFAATRRRP
jgi:TetR/AcrR family transcriptional regulator, cholesterol catabolism regulator